MVRSRVYSRSWRALSLCCPTCIPFKYTSDPKATTTPPRHRAIHTTLNFVRDCLKGYTYPQIRNLLISPSALPFICVCPKLKVLKPYKARYLSVSDDMMDRVPELEVLGHIHMNDKILKGTSESLNCVLPPSLTRTIPSSHQKIAEFARLDHKQVTF